MKKTLFVLVLVIALSFTLYSSPAYADEIKAIEYTEVAGNYPDGTTGFVYSDDFLLGESSEMSGDLCKIAAALSAAAYTQGSVSSMLGEVGYICSEFDYGERSLYDNDRVAYVTNTSHM